MKNSRVPALFMGAALVAGAAGDLSARQAPPAAPAAPTTGRGFSRPEAIDSNEHAGWTSMFDGATLSGWDGNPAVWKVDAGVIVAESTADRRVGTTYIIWKGGEVADFEWKLEVRLGGDIHSGIAYRSWIDPNRAATLGPAAAPLPPLPAPPRAGAPAPGRGRGPQPPPEVPSDPRWMLYGPGMDNDADRRNTGNVEDRNTARRYVGWRGSVVRAETGKVPRVVAGLGDADALMDVIKVDDWNEVHIIARGNQLTHIINGRLMAITIDEDTSFYTPKGLLGWSIEGFGLGRVSVRNLWLKKLQ
jgi:hypothetical protein